MTPEDHASDQVMGSLLPFQRQVQTCGIKRLIIVQCTEWLSYTLYIQEVRCFCCLREGSNSCWMNADGGGAD